MEQKQKFVRWEKAQGRHWLGAQPLPPPRSILQNPGKDRGFAGLTPYGAPEADEVGVIYPHL